MCSVVETEKGATAVGRAAAEEALGVDWEEEVGWGWEAVAGSGSEAASEAGGWEVEKGLDWGAGLDWGLAGAVGWGAVDLEAQCTSHPSSLARRRRATRRR
jgi:hypothetical protein